MDEKEIRYHLKNLRESIDSLLKVVNYNFNSSDVFFKLVDNIFGNLSGASYLLIQRLSDIIEKRSSKDNEDGKEMESVFSVEFHEDKVILEINTENIFGYQKDSDEFQNWFCEDFKDSFMKNHM